MKIQSRSVLLVASAVVFLLACNLGGATQGASVPTLAATTEETAATSPPAPQGGDVAICTLMTNDEASAILGGAVTGAPREGGEAGRRFTNCEFVLGAQSLTLQAGDAEQVKELLMAAAYNMQKMQADPNEQAVIDDTAANLSSLTAQQVADRIFPMYDSHCFIATPLDVAGDAGRWITCPRLKYAAVSARRGSTEEELVYVDVVWLGSSQDEAAQQALLITAVKTGLDRLPLGSHIVPGN